MKWEVVEMEKENVRVCRREKRGKWKVMFGERRG